MPTYDWPETLVPQSAQFVLRKAGTQFASPFNGTPQSLDFIAERWTLTCDLAQMAARNPRGVHSFCNLLAGGVNRVRAWNFGHNRGVPRGSARGTPTLHATVNRGDTSLTIVGVRGTSNLVASMMEFGAAPWSGSATVTSDTHAFGGATHADTLTDSDSGAFQQRAQSTSVPPDHQLYTLSVYVRKTTGGTSPTFGVNLNLSGGTGVAVNARLNTDTGAVSGPGVAAVSHDADWWRFSAPITNNGSNNTISVGFFPATAAHGSFTDSAAATGSAVVALPQITRGAFVAVTFDDWRPTLLADDMLGVGGQIFQVATDCRAFTGGTLVVPLVNRVRATITSGAAVTLIRPTAEFVMPAMQAGPVVRPGAIESTALDLIEVW